MLHTSVYCSCSVKLVHGRDHSTTCILVKVLQFLLNLIQLLRDTKLTFKFPEILCASNLQHLHLSLGHFFTHS